MVIWGRSGTGACESKGGKQINPSLICLHFTVLCLEKASAHRGTEAGGADTGGVASSGSSEF